MSPAPIRFRGTPAALERIRQFLLDAQAAFEIETPESDTDSYIVHLFDPSPDTRHLLLQILQRAKCVTATCPKTDERT